MLRQPVLKQREKVQGRRYLSSFNALRHFTTGTSFKNMVNRGPAFVSCLALIAVFVGNCLGSEYPEVNSPLGRVRGYYRTTDGGRNISAFEGVPFAKPPVGELRFEVSLRTFL